MSPWSIIGWAVVMFGGLVAMVALALFVSNLLTHQIRHWRTFRTPAAEGQVWLGPKGSYRVVDVRGNGVHWIRPHYMSISGERDSETKQEWKRRVRRETLWLSADLSDSKTQ